MHDFLYVCVCMDGCESIESEQRKKKKKQNLRNISYPCQC